MKCIVCSGNILMPLNRTQEIAEACRLALDSLKYIYPEEITSEGRTPQEELTMLTWQGAKQMFGEVIPEKTIATIKHELAFIEQMNYASYFLTVYDIVRYARQQKFFARAEVLQQILLFVFVWV